MAAQKLIILALIALPAAAAVQLFGDAAGRSIIGATEASMPSLGSTQQAAGLGIAQRAVELARRQAALYSATMRRFNGPRPKNTLSRLADRWAPTGRVAYWDIDANTPGLETTGRAFSDTPLYREDGTVRVPVHYLDEDRIAYMTQRFGAPSGDDHAEIASSLRSLTSFPEGERPYGLKFGAEWHPGHRPSVGSNKSLPTAELRVNVARSEALEGLTSLQPEPAALSLGDAADAPRLIYRELPRVAGGRPDDIPIVAHALLRADESGFADRALARRVAHHYGSVAQMLEQAFAPALADALVELIFDGFVHPAAHSQNLDAVFARDGALRAVLVKDIPDLEFDMPLQIAMTGRRPQNAAELRMPDVGHIGEAYNVASVERIHYEWLKQTLDAAPGLEDAVRQHFAEGVKTRLGLSSDDAEAARLLGGITHPDARMPTVIQQVRDYVIDSRLQQGFVPDEAARDAFVRAAEALVDGRAGEGMIAGRVGWKGGALGFARTISGQKSVEAGHRLDPGAYTFGYLGEVPSAIRRSEDGAIEEYFFAYEFTPAGAK